MSDILVIGGSSGIGKEVVNQLREQGHQVSAPSKETLDVTSFFDTYELLDAELTFFDGIVYCAGVSGLRHIGPTIGDETEGASDEEIMGVNFHGFVHLLDAMEAVGFGKRKPVSVVAVGSDAATRPMRTSLMYCSSKAALHMAVRCAARELGADGYRINCVAPGMTHGTGIQKYIDEAVPEIRGWSLEKTMEYERSQEVVPGRISVQEVAEVIISTLFGPAHLNGSIVTINGGR